MRRTYDGEEFDGKVGEREWPICRERSVEGDSNATKWTASIDVDALCDGNLDRKIQLVLVDYHTRRKLWEDIGSFDTTVNKLLSKSVSETFMLKGKRKVIVTSCQIDGAADPILEDPAVAPVTDPYKDDIDNSPEPNDMKNVTEEKVSKEADPIPEDPAVASGTDPNEEDIDNGDEGASIDSDKENDNDAPEPNNVKNVTEEKVNKEADPIPDDPAVASGADPNEEDIGNDDEGAPIDPDKEDNECCFCNFLVVLLK